MKIVNLDKHQYLTPEAFGNAPTLEGIATSRDGIMQGLAVLCADGNGRGGGDLNVESEVVGSWAGDRIVLVSAGVCQAELSEPGLEDIPLLEQVLKIGVDVSDAVIAAIVEGEGDYSEMKGLPAEQSLRLKYRTLFGAALHLFQANSEGQHRRLRSLPELLELFSCQVEETPKLTVVRMVEGINRIAEAFDQPVRWSLDDTLTVPSRLGSPAYRVTLTSNEGAQWELVLSPFDKELTAAKVFTSLGLQCVLQPYQRRSLLPAAVEQIVMDTLAGVNLKGGA